MAGQVPVGFDPILHSLKPSRASGPPLWQEDCSILVSFLLYTPQRCYLWQALDEQQRQVELKREARLREIQEKQKIREERARRARERVSCVLFCLDGKLGNDRCVCVCVGGRLGGGVIHTNSQNHVSGE